ELWEESRRHERITERLESEIHRARYLSLWWNEGKNECYVQGRLGAEQGAKLEAAVRKRAATIKPTDDPFDPAEAAAADALVALATETKTGQASEPLLVVHADVATLMGEDPDEGPVLAETSSGVRLSGATVRRLAEEAPIEWVLEDEGRCVGVGFQTKRPPEWLRRRLEERDGGCCRFPGCVATRWLKAHHIAHWPHGPTDLGNLVLLCWFHHNLVHKARWKIRGDPARELGFVDPYGRILLSVARASLRAALRRPEAA
ncbi:MAG: DUF222 domain-containing protein, partial [Actinomycetota bacterium]